MVTPLVMGSATILAAVVNGAIASPAHANESLQWSFDPAQRQLSITVPNGAEPSYFLLAEPPRIVVDVSAEVGNLVEEQAYSGAVRHIRVGQFQPGMTRIVMELSPDVVFSPGQVEMSSAGGDRWVVRPLLADSAPIATAPPTPASVEMDTTATSDIEFSAPSAAIAPDASTEPSNEMELPPLEPGAVELNVPEPEELAEESAPNPSETPAPQDTAIAPASTTLQSPPDALSTDLFAPFPDISSASVEEDVAAAVSDVDSVAVMDEPMDLRDESTETDEAAIAPEASDMSDRLNAETVSFPSPTESSQASPPTTASPVSRPSVSGTSVDDGSVSMLEFGQPLPSATSSVWLPVGTQLMLRYPGARSLRLTLGSPRQDVLLLHQPVVDSSGRIVVPANTQVLGRFETSTAGSRFVVQAMSVNGQNIQVEGQSDWLGDRSVSEADLIRNAAIGAAAGTVLTTITGDASGVALIGGAAAGAATTYITASEPAVIQPNQLIEVQLTEDLAVR